VSILDLECYITKKIEACRMSRYENLQIDSPVTDLDKKLTDLLDQILVSMEEINELGSMLQTRNKDENFFRLRSCTWCSIMQTPLASCMSFPDVQVGNFAYLLSDRAARSDSTAIIRARTWVALRHLLTILSPLASVIHLHTGIRITTQIKNPCQNRFSIVRNKRFHDTQQKVIMLS
jgi:hypothetical protein